MEFTKKAKEITDLMEAVAGKPRTMGECATCDNKFDPVEEFRDVLSLKEYRISGMCQKCQDSVFGGDE